MSSWECFKLHKTLQWTAREWQYELVWPVINPGRGALSIYTGGGVPRHNRKMGILGTGTTQKSGGLMHGNEHGHESKKGRVLGTVTSRKLAATMVRGVLTKNWSCKKDNLSNWCCTKWRFGSLFINYLYFFLVNMINWWGFTLTD